MNIATTLDWSTNSWQKFPRVQQPNWHNNPELQVSCEQLAKYPPLIFAGEVRKLREELALVEDNKAFIIQCGDCAETFDQCNAVSIRENLKILLQMSIVLTFAAGKHVVKISRIAGQYAKPRSSDLEEVNGIMMPSYRGDMVNSELPDLALRQPNPRRMIDAYFHATATLNLLRGYTHGGFAGLENVHRWNKDFVKNGFHGQRYEELARQIDKNLNFIRAIGLDRADLPQISVVDLYTSHEALILEYEQALTRKDTISGVTLDCSAHFLWIGNRTRQVDSAHVEFLRGVANPIGIKIDADTNCEELVLIIKKLNPDNQKGKIVLITRMGADKVEAALPAMVTYLAKTGLNFSYICDPMHGNTIKSGGYKTRKFDVVLSEIVKTSAVLRELGHFLGGIHIEATGLNVTECIGGQQDISESNLKDNYSTSCDPRLNASQSVELAFILADQV